jgi:hypothetical protein
MPLTCPPKPPFLWFKSRVNLLFHNLIYYTVVTIWTFQIITEIFCNIIIITTVIWKKAILYYLWGVFSVYGNTIAITDGDYDDDFAPPAKKRGRCGPKPTRRSIAMALWSANGERTPIVIPPVPVEKNRRRVAKTPAAEVERETPEGIFDEFGDSEDEEDIVSQ